MAAAIAALWAAVAAGNGGQQHPDPLVRFTVAVELSKAHFVVSQSVLEAGKPTRALVHAAHPVQELGAQVYGPPTRVSAELGERVRAAMKKPGQALEAKVAGADYARTVQQTLQSLDEAVARVVPEAKRTSPAFTLAVVGELMKAVAGDYEMAFADGKIVLEVEFQDAVGFYTRARSLFRAVQPRLPSALARTIERELERLAPILAGMSAPASPVPPTQVTAIVQRILAEATAAGRAPGAGASRQ
jgi:hypothetical protein